MSLLSQNRKMKKTSDNDIVVYNFGIPALKSETGLSTCPNAGLCAVGCYAKSGAYLWDNVKNAYEKRLAATLQSDFVFNMQKEIETLLKKHNTKKLVIRIHDSGDFYSAEYLAAWFNIMQKFPIVTFYAYTKMVSLIKGRMIPNNFTVIYSYGGKKDHLINPLTDRHSQVFDSIASLQAANYVDVSTNDLLAIGANPRIGLVYHGAKSFKNTLWNKTGINNTENSTTI